MAGATENLKSLMVPEDVEVAPESAIGAPAAAGLGAAVILATGGAWMVTVTLAGALCTPRLSVTTSVKVTCPDVLGTDTVMLGEEPEMGAFGSSGVAVEPPAVVPTAVVPPPVVPTGAGTMTGAVGTGGGVTGGGVTGGVAGGEIGSVEIGSRATI